MMLRLATIAALALAGMSGQVAAFWPYASAVELVAAPPLMMDYTFPAGTTIWHNPLVIEGQTGMTIRGQRGNRGPSRMVYRGGPTKAVIELRGCSRCKILDLEVVDESGCDAGILITNSVNPPVDGYSTANLISNVRVLHEGKVGPKRAFSVDSYAGGGRDGNNEQHRFERCMAQSYSEAGFYVSGSQCHQLTFEQCAALDYGGRHSTGLHASEGGYFQWRDGSMTANAVDFKLGTAEQQVIIDGHSSEQSTQFLVMGTAGGDAVVSVSNVRWDCNPVAGRPVIDGYGPNTISIRDSWFAGTNGVCPTFRFRGTGGPLDMSGVLIRQHGGNAPTTAIVTAGSTWDARLNAVRWQRLNEPGVVPPRTTRAVAMNKVLPGPIVAAVAGGTVIP